MWTVIVYVSVAPRPGRSRVQVTVPDGDARSPRSAETKVVPAGIASVSV